MKVIRKGFSSQFTTVIYSLRYSETAYNISWDSIFLPQEASRRNCLALSPEFWRRNAYIFQDFVLDASKNTYSLWIYETSS